MKRIDLAAIAEWDDLERLRAEAGKVFNDPTDEKWATYHRLNSMVPETDFVEVVTGRDYFSVKPAEGQAHDQLALGSLYRKVRSLGWRVANLVKRFDPSLALEIVRLYGRGRLGYKSSWLKVTLPEAILIKGAQQERPDSVAYMIEALRNEEAPLSLSTFWSLSARSIARTLPAGEAEQYLEALGVR